MPVKTITLCKDETFHPEICLVAIEPVSNFILVERYAMDRKTKTWDEAVCDAIKQTHEIEHEKEKFNSAEKRPRGRRPHFEERIERAKQEEQQIKEALEQAHLNYETVRNAKAEIGKVGLVLTSPNAPSLQAISCSASWTAFITSFIIPSSSSSFKPKNSRAPCSI